MHRIMISLTMMLTAAAAAQDARPNFSGTWKYEPSPVARDREIDRIDHREPLFSISEKVGRADVIFTLDFRTDGREVRGKRGGGDVVRTGRWEGATLVLQTKTLRGETATIEEEKLSLSPDGKVMTKVVHFLGPSQKSEQRIELKKISDGIRGISIGDTPEVVRHEWGEPDAVENRGKETVFVYLKTSMEVIFVDGKMTDSGYRKP